MIAQVHQVVQVLVVELVRELHLRVEEWTRLKLEGEYRRERVLVYLPHVHEVLVEQ